MHPLMFVIWNDRTEEFWSNEHGWVDYVSADKFTPRETESLNLPIDGHWLTLSTAEKIIAG